MVGLGGVAVEVLKDVALAPVPLSDGDARELLARLKGAALLGPIRGAPPADVDALVELMVRLGQFAADHADTIAEIDLNPGAGARAGQGRLGGRRADCQTLTGVLPLPRVRDSRRQRCTHPHVQGRGCRRGARADAGAAVCDAGDHGQRRAHRDASADRAQDRRRGAAGAHRMPCRAPQSAVEDVRAGCRRADDLPGGPRPTSGRAGIPPRPSTARRCRPGTMRWCTPTAGSRWCRTPPGCWRTCRS